MLNEAGLDRTRTPSRCTSPAPVAIAARWSKVSLPACCAVAPRVSLYKGHRGAIVHMGMTVMAHNAAMLVRIHQDRLSKRAQKFRRLLRLKRHKVNEFNGSKN